MRTSENQLRREGLRGAPSPPQRQRAHARRWAGAATLLGLLAVTLWQINKTDEPPPMPAPDLLALATNLTPAAATSAARPPPAPADAALARLKEAQAAYEAGQWDQAIAGYRAALQIQPDNPDAHFNLGLACNARGLTNEAEQAYRRAIELSPRHLGARMNLGNLLARQGRHAEADALLRTLWQQMPETPANHNNYGALLGRMGRTEEALQHFEQALRLEARYEEARFNYANAHLRLGHWEAAITNYEMLLRERPGWTAVEKLLQQARQAKAAAEKNAPPAPP